MIGLESVTQGVPGIDDRPIERERREIAGAIALVAEGGFPSVVIANLAHPELVADEFEPLAEAMGVRIELIGHRCDTGSDVAVRQQ